MYWDISAHRRRPGRRAWPTWPLLILAGLFGMFAAGLLAMAMLDERLGRAAVRISEGWYAPVGGVLIAACGVLPHRLPARRRVAPHLRPGRHALGPDPPDADRRGRHVARRPGHPLAEAMQYRRERTGTGSPPATEVGRLRVSPAAITSLRAWA